MVRQTAMWEVSIYKKVKKLFGGYEKKLVQRYLSGAYRPSKEREYVIVEVKPLNRAARRVTEKKEKK